MWLILAGLSPRQSIKLAGVIDETSAAAGRIAVIRCLGGVSVNRPIALGFGRLVGRCFRKWRMPPALSSAPIAEYIPSLFAGVNGRIHKGERPYYQSHPRPIFFV
ncbi:Hypothetical protein GbCGDNIH6_7090 [Granulibacter bethesdensis]|nr:Hypothetical protein GbCGDNIH6_7090 [Granulibacter bethesdensis]